MEDEIESGETSKAANDEATTDGRASVDRFPYPLQGGQTSQHIKVEQVAGPVLPVERKHDYRERSVAKEQSVARDVTYPVYGVEGSHQYQVDEIQAIEPEKHLVGPKYSVDDGKSGYVPPTPMADITPEINAPVFKGVESSNKFTPTLPPKIEGEALMSGPMFPVDHSSNYTTQQFGCSGKGLHVEKQKVLAAPGNRDTGSSQAAIIEGKNMYCPELQ